MLNDDGIYDENPFFVRAYYCGDQNLLESLKGAVANADLQNMQELQYRDSILRIIFRLHQYKPDVLGPQFTPVLYQHRQNILALMSQPEADQDLQGALAGFQQEPGR